MFHLHLKLILFFTLYIFVYTTIAQDRCWTGSVLSECEVKALWENSGFTGPINTMVCIARYESGRNTHACNENTNGSWDYGMYQCNNNWWCTEPGFTANNGCSMACEDLFIKERTIECATKVYQQQGLTAWYAYSSHKSECDSYTVTGCCNPSCVHGSCVAGNCVCENLWLGSDCNTPTKCWGVNFNSGSVCSGHGDCIGTNNCRCDTGYEGTTCNTFKCNGISKDSSAVCSGHGTCVSPNKCTCVNMWTGTWCSTPVQCWGVNFNSVNVCSKHGTCIGSNQCSCHSMWNGNTCSNPVECYGVDFNVASVCSYHGTCIAADNCNCNSMYTGNSCANPVECYGIDFNDVNVCNSHGTCLSANNCQCFNSVWAGNECENPLCDTGCFYGDCMGDLNAVWCDCYSGWIGSVCDEPDSNNYKCYGVSHDSTAVCSGKGTCINNDLCICLPENTGNKCQFDVIDGLACYGYSSTDLGNVCSGNGACLNNDECSCNDMWEGIKCEIPYECFGISHTNTSYVCAGNGQCVNRDKCSCNSGYGNSQCSRHITGSTIAAGILVPMFILGILVLLVAIAITIYYILKNKQQLNQKFNLIKEEMNCDESESFEMKSFEVGDEDDYMSGRPAPPRRKPDSYLGMKSSIPKSSIAPPPNKPNINKFQKRTVRQSISAFFRRKPAPIKPKAATRNYNDDKNPFMENKRKLKSTKKKRSSIKDFFRKRKAAPSIPLERGKSNSRLQKSAPKPPSILRKKGNSSYLRKAPKPIRNKENSRIIKQASEIRGKSNSRIEKTAPKPPRSIRNKENSRLKKEPPKPPK